jgi:membrane-bound serine protease (ClpP class)
LFLSLCALHAAENVGVDGSTSAQQVLILPIRDDRQVFILPIRDDIMPPLVYLVRRGVKAAMDAKADLLVLDMDTNGGRVDVTEEIIGIISQFKGQTVTFVNHKAFSAGAFISVATQKIYMAPQSVIGAAAPIILSPGGGGVEKTPDTFEAKMTSGVSALVRTRAEKNGYNIAVVEKMIDKSKELKMDGEVLNEKGAILTLTNLEAEKEYGQPRRPLLSSGTVENLDTLLNKLGFSKAARHVISPTGVEKIGTWINAISPILLIIGVIGIYIEFKTPGFGLPGIVGIAAFAVYFLGGYVAGLSGMEWLLVFILGLVLVAVELFVFPGTIALGMIGVVLMLASIIMALVDMYPGMPAVPTLPQLRLPLEQLVIAFLGSAIGVVILSRILPRTPMYRTLVSQTASGMVTELAVAEHRASLQGQVGVAISNLRPGGKAQFGDQVLDVISQGDMVTKGRKVKIIGYSGREAVVAVVD